MFWYYQRKDDCMMKRYAMECVGTFFLTVAISLIAHPVAIGLVLMAMIYVGGHISGAHFNPAISLVCFMQKRLSLNDMGMYVLAQSLGAALALCVFTALTNSNFVLDIAPGSPMVGPMVIEALFVVLFAWVYLTMNFGKHKDTAVPGLVLGLTLLAMAFAGGLFNPAVALASMVCSVIKEGMFGTMPGVVTYVAGPLLGAFGASFMYDYFKSEA
jgi:aquaporin Z